MSQLEEEQETKSKKISRLEREIKHLEELKKSAASGDVQINEIRTKVKVEVSFIDISLYHSVCSREHQILVMMVDGLNVRIILNMNIF